MDDDGDDGSENSVPTLDFPEWLDRLRRLLLLSYRKVKKKKKTAKSTASNRRRTTSSAAGAERIRRLSAVGATANMSPAEILGAILTSVGVGAAGGGPLRRRSTSSPEATPANLAPVGSVGEEETPTDDDAGEGFNLGVSSRLHDR